MTPLLPDDPIPMLRNNVLFGGSPSGVGERTLKVTNTANGEELSLRGFECSLARMLDGHRTVREVLAAAHGVGLPVTHTDLDGFISKLSIYDLVTQKAERVPTGESSPWTP